MDTVSPSPAPQGRHEGAGKTLLILVAALLLSLGILLVFAPAILSTELGVRLLQSRVNAKIAGELEVTHVDVNWFSGQSVKGLVVRDAQGREVLACDEIRTNASLFHVLSGNLHLDETVCTHPWLTLYPQSNGQTSLEKALAPKKPARPVRPQPPSDLGRQLRRVSGDFKIEGGKILIVQSEKDSVAFDNINALLSLPMQAGLPLVLTASTQTSEGNDQGQLALDMQVADWQQFLSAPPAAPQRLLGWLPFFESGRFRLDLKASHLPLQGCDQLLTLAYPKAKGVLQTAFGGNVDLQLGVLSPEEASSWIFAASSPNVKAEVKGKAEGGFFTLDPASQISFLCTPEFATNLAAATQTPFPFLLEKATQTQLSLTTFKTPLPWSDAAAIEPLALNTLLQIEPATLKSQVPQITQLALQRMSMQLQTQEGSGSLTASLTAEALVDNHDMRLQADAKTQGLPLSADLPPTTVMASLSKVSPELLDAFFNSTDKLFQNIFGSEINMTLNGTAQGQTAQIACSLISPQLQASELTFQVDKAISLQKPGTVTLNPSPALLKMFTDDVLNLKAQGPVTLTIRSLSFPRALFDFSKIACDADLSLDKLVVREFEDVGLFSLAQFKAAIQGTDLTKPTVRLTTQVSLDRPLPLLEALGQPLFVNFTFNPLLTPSGAFKNGTFQLRATHLDSSFATGGKVNKEGDFAFTEPSKVQLPVTNELFHALVPNSQFKLTRPTTTTLTIDPLEGTLEPFVIRGASGTFTIDTIALSYGDEQTTLNQFAVQFKGDPMSAWASFSALAESTSKLTGDVSFTDYIHRGTFDFSRASWVMHSQCDAIPIALVEALTGHGGELVPLFGESVQLTLQGQYKTLPQPQGNLDVIAKGDGVQFRASMGLDDWIVLQGSPAKLTWTLTPQRFQALQKMVSGNAAPSNIALKDQATLNVKINNFSLPRQLVFTPAGSPPRVDLTRIGLDAQAVLDPFTLTDPASQQSALLSGWQIRVQAQDLTKPAQLKAAGQIQASSSEPGQKPGTLSIVAACSDLLTNVGAYNAGNVSASWTADIQDLSVEWLTSASAMAPALKQNILSILGPQVSAKATGDLKRMSGPLNVDLQSTYSSLHLAGNMVKKVLSLREPLTAQIQVTPDLAGALLKTINPLFVTTISASAPIKLTVDPAGFSVPVAPLSFDGARIGNALLEPGVLQMTTGGVLDLLLSFLKAQDSIHNNRLTVWCTPISMQMQSGIATFNRMDALVNGVVHIASWGSADFNKDRLNMSLGISGDSIERAYSIVDLPDNYLFVVPMTGTIGKVKIDWAKASARIAGLVARSKGGSTGAGIGAVLDLFGGGQEESVPPLSQPLPWEQPGAGKHAP